MRGARSAEARPGTGAAQLGEALQWRPSWEVAVAILSCSKCAASAGRTAPASGRCEPIGVDAAQAPLGVDAGRGARPGRSTRRLEAASEPCTLPMWSPGARDMQLARGRLPAGPAASWAARRSEACYRGEHCRTRGSDGRAAGDGRARPPRRSSLPASGRRRRASGRRRRGGKWRVRFRRSSAEFSAALGFMVPHQRKGARRRVARGS